MIGFPFDSRVTYNPDGTPIYDRAITSEPYRKLLNWLFKTGVMPTPSTNMQVTAGEGLKVVVLSGFAMVNGLMKYEESNVTVELEEAHLQYNRIDTIVLRLNNNSNVRACEYAVITGTPSSNPVAPELVRNNSIYDIGLANVLVRSNSTQVSQANITDTRYDSSRCGVISSISEFDTTTIYEQIQADLQEFKDGAEADFESWTDEQKALFLLWTAQKEDEFDEWADDEETMFVDWFNHIKGQLSGDVATSLQTQIDSIKYIYFRDETIYLPNTSASYDLTDEIIMLGTETLQEV